MRQSRKNHEPVLVREVLEALKIAKIAHLNTQARFIDATVGGGGHSLEIVREGGDVLGIEKDPEMLAIAEERLKKARLGRGYGGQACPTPDSIGGRFKLVHGDFAKIKDIAEKYGFVKVDGILFDLGVASSHFESPRRGLSFSYPKAPLDMRIDRLKQKVKASDLLNSLRKDQLIKLFSVVVPYKSARKLAERVVGTRVEKPIDSVGDFLEAIAGSVPRKGKLHPATKAFLALRVAVNSELENLKEALPKAFGLLKNGGRLVVISFHSGEDSIVKKFYKKMETDSEARLITKKPVLPAPAEIKANPKARSAKMRVLERI